MSLWPPPPLVWVMSLVIIQRIAELALARRNTRRLLARGGREVGAGHYPLMVSMHAAWLAAIIFTTPIDVAPDWRLLGAYLVLQGLRLWVIASLGEYWTTRIITVDGAPLVRTGPFRFLRHPNYLIVTAEIAILPLAFHNLWVAVIFTVLNQLMVRHRIRVEQAALDARP
jgi:methyltransferase